MSEPPPPPKGEGSVEELARSVGQVVHSALGVGAALARWAANNTARGSVPQPPSEDEPLTALIHYGALTFRNVVGVVGHGAQVLKVRVSAAPAPSPSPPGAAPAAAAGPRVHAGSTLRVPLSVENPSDQPMGPLHFRGEVSTVAGAAVPDAEGWVTVAPERLVIQPHDFEKLTLAVLPPAGTPRGRYRVRVTAPPQSFLAEINFEVVAD